MEQHERCHESGAKLRVVLTDMGHYCGYCDFSEKPVKECGYEGILVYVPVHGGITYADNSITKGGMTYGFDCAHAYDDKNPNLRDIEWLFNEVGRMATCILIAAKFEDEYLLSQGDNKKRAEIIDNYHVACKERCDATFNLNDNFGALLCAMSGHL